jgi:hypothetical protein
MEAPPSVPILMGSDDDPTPKQIAIILKNIVMHPATLDHNRASHMHSLVRLGHVEELREIMEHKPSLAWLKRTLGGLINVAIECYMPKHRVDIVTILVKAMETMETPRRLARALQKAMIILSTAATHCSYDDVTIFAILVGARARALGSDLDSANALDMHPVSNAVAMSVAMCENVDLMHYFATTLKTSMTDAVIETMFQNASTIRMESSLNCCHNGHNVADLCFDDIDELVGVLLESRPIAPLLACCADANFKGCLDFAPALAWCSSEVASAIVNRLTSEDRDRLQQTMRVMHRTGVPPEIRSLIAHRVLS